MTPPKVLRPVWAEVDLGAVRHNVARLAALARPGQLCAVVKANGYGHGAVPVARAALDGGATWLGVALVEEGAELRDAGIEAPILVLSEPPLDAMEEVVGRRLTPTVFTAQQIERFERVRLTLQRRGILPDLVHAANSAGLIAHPASRYNLVRCGIAIYGIDPDPRLAGRVDLRPAMSLKARVSFVKEVPPGDRISYGLRYAVGDHSVVATIPAGYADGVTRRLSSVGGEVLVGGRRQVIAGAVTMDQIMVDCGPDADVATGDEVVLIG